MYGWLTLLYSRHWHNRLLCPWGIFRQEYWSGSPSPPPGHLPDPGFKPMSLASPASSGGFLPLHHQGSPKINSTSIKKRLMITINNLKYIKYIKGIIFKMDSQQVPYHTWNCSMLCDSLDGRGSGGRMDAVYVWLSPFDVHLKLSQHY